MAYRLLWSNTAVLVTDQIFNTTSETTFGAQVPFPANADTSSHQGRTIRLKGFFALSTAPATPGTLILKIKWGASVLAASAAIALPAGLANAGGWFEAVVVICATGSGGKISCQGFGMIDNAGTPISFSFVNAGVGAAGQATINTQNAANLGVSAQFSSAASSTVTMTIASPGVITWNAHGLSAGAPIVFATSGALPTGLVAGTEYYVVSPTTNAFSVAATPGGAAINTSGSQSGTHTAGVNIIQLLNPVFEMAA